MPFDPGERVPMGDTGVSVTRLGFGAASIAGLYRPVEDADARKVIDRAWNLGIRLFDVAPLYGYGTGERRIGAALRERPRDDYVLSTKVGRLVRTAATMPPGADVDRQRFEGRDNAFYAGIDDRRIVFDYSADGVRRSVEESLERLGLDRIDILFIHDPDEHWQQAVRGAVPELVRMREEGTVRAIGAGMNQAGMLARFVRETDVDVVLVAGRYTLIDQAALPELLPLALQRNVAVFVAGVMNSGVLASPTVGGRFDYKPAKTRILDRARRVAAICARHDVPVATAAVQFALAHPATTALVTGVRSIDHLEDYPDAFRATVPSDLWQELRNEGLIPAAAPIPAAAVA